MKTTIKQINDGLITKADFSAMALTVNFAIKIAQALELNTKINCLDISMSNLSDEKFLPIAKALLARSTPLIELNVECSNLSTQGVDELIKLIINKKVGILFIYKNDKISPPDMERLLEAAKMKEVTVNLQNPIERKDPKGYARFLAQPKPTSYDSLLAADKENITEEKEQSIPSKRK